AFLLSWLGVLSFSILGTSLLTAQDGKGIEFDNALAILAVSNATAFGGYLFHGWLGDRIGRRNTISLGWILCGFSFTGMLLAPHGNLAVVIALYSAGLFFLIGPYAALLFFNAESFPVHTRATGGSFINACGQVGAFIASFGITVSLCSGATWIEATAIWGCVPIFLSGLVILGARNVRSEEVHLDCDISRTTWTRRGRSVPRAGAQSTAVAAVRGGIWRQREGRSVGNPTRGRWWRCPNTPRPSVSRRSRPSTDAATSSSRRSSLSPETPQTQTVASVPRCARSPKSRMCWRCFPGGRAARRSTRSPRSTPNVRRMLLPG